MLVKLTPVVADHRECDVVSIQFFCHRRVVEHFDFVLLTSSVMKSGPLNQWFSTFTNWRPNKQFKISLAIHKWVATRLLRNDLLWVNLDFRTMVPYRSPFSAFFCSGDCEILVEIENHCLIIKPSQAFSRCFHIVQRNNEQAYCTVN